MNNATETKKAKTNFGKDVIWNLIGQFAYLFGLWLITVLTTRYAGYEAQGVLSLALVASNICMSFANYYLRLQYAADIENKYADSDYVTARFTLTAISALICFVYCLVLQYSWAVLGSIMLYYVYKIFEMLSDIYQGVLQRHGKLYIGGYTMTAKGVLSVGAFAVITMLTHDLNLGLLGLAIIGGLIFALDVLLTRKKTTFRINWRAYSIKKVWSLVVLCFPLFILLFCSNVLPSLPRIFFEKMYSKQELGYYASIANIAVLIQTAAVAIMMPLVPKISELYKTGQTKKFLKFDGVIIAALVALSGLACLLVYFLGDWALKLVYGDEIGPYTYTFIWAIVATAMTAFVTIVTQILGAMEKRFWATIAMLVGTGICAALSYPLCRDEYMNGISFSLIIAEGVTVVLCLVFIFLCRKNKAPLMDDEPDADPTTPS